jgi:hypothetical protein
LRQEAAAVSYDTSCADLLARLLSCHTWQEVARLLDTVELEFFWRDERHQWQGVHGPIEDGSLRQQLNHLLQPTSQADTLYPLRVRGLTRAVLRATPAWGEMLAGPLALWIEARTVHLTHHARTLIHQVHGLSETALESAGLLWQRIPLVEDGLRGHAGEVVGDLEAVQQASKELLALIAPDAAGHPS